jgi:hypothetical protein
LISVRDTEAEDDLPDRCPHCGGCGIETIPAKVAALPLSTYRHRRHAAGLRINPKRK